MLLGIAAVLAGKQGTPATTRGTFEGNTHSDGTSPLRRACWACRNLKRDAHDFTGAGAISWRESKRLDIQGLIYKFCTDSG